MVSPHVKISKVGMILVLHNLKCKIRILLCIVALLTRHDNDTIAMADNMLDVYSGDELYLEIREVKTGKIYHHCRFDGNKFQMIAVVACRHFNHAFGEVRAVGIVFIFENRILFLQTNQTEFMGLLERWSTCWKKGF